MSQNIDQFNEVTASVFAKLYESFPVEVELEVSDFTEESTQQYYWTMSLSAGFAPEGHTQLVQHAIRWLIKEGYIHTKGESMASFRGCTLTGKGLETLNSTPKSLDTTLGDKLVEAVKGESSAVAKDIVRKALAYGTSLVF